MKFLNYKWQNAYEKPATYTFYTNGKIVGGIVYFGTAFAETKIWVDGDRIVSDN